MKTDVKTEKDVRAVIEECLKAYSEKDFRRALELVAPDADVVFIGTNVKEKMIGKEQMKVEFGRYASQLDSISFDVQWISVSATGAVAWAALDGLCEVAAGESKVQFPFRITMVLEKRQDQWLIVQSHTSMPAAEPV